MEHRERESFTRTRAQEKTEAIEGKIDEWAKRREEKRSNMEARLIGESFKNPPSQP